MNAMTNEEKQGEGHDTVVEFGAYGGGYGYAEDGVGVYHQAWVSAAVINTFLFDECRF